LSRSEFEPGPLLDAVRAKTPVEPYTSVFSIGHTAKSVSGSTLYLEDNFTPETNRFPPSR
jgi:hypothetical protein